MQTLHLTAKDFKQSDGYYKTYIGTENVGDYDGHIERNWVAKRNAKGCGEFRR